MSKNKTKSDTDNIMYYISVTFTNDTFYSIPPFQPDPLYRTLSRRVAQAPNCANVCPPTPPVDHTGVTCKSNRWVPNYVAKGDCECLTEYKCCGDTCPTANVETCWSNNQKGRAETRGANGVALRVELA